MKYNPCHDIHIKMYIPLFVFLMFVIAIDLQIHMVINADTLIVDDLGRLVADVHSLPCDPTDGQGKDGAGNYGGSGKFAMLPFNYSFMNLHRSFTLQRVFSKEKEFHHFDFHSLRSK